MILNESREKFKYVDPIVFIRYYNFIKRSQCLGIMNY